MKYEGFTCIDAGTDYCPCHLAETGDCIICSMLQNKDECICNNWCNTCIYNDYLTNNKKIKEGRKYYNGRIISKTFITNNVFLLTIHAPFNLIKELTLPGSFIFLKHPDSESFYDTPLSVMNVSVKDKTLELAIEIRGPKTNKINELKKDEYILLRGPYWNGIIGVSYINKILKSNVLTISRGIHQAPLVPVIKKLKNNNNNIYSLIDTGRIGKIFIKKYLDDNSFDYLKTNILRNNSLSFEFTNNLTDYIFKIKPSLIFSAASDKINYKVLKLINSISDDINFACTNNSKMCCGEGICGCCVIKNKDHILRRLCKMQTDPEFILEGRY